MGNRILTPKQNLFAIEIAKGQHPIEAFKTAFPKRAERLTDDSLKVAAHSLNRKEQIQEKVKELQTPAINAIDHHIQDSVNDLMNIKRLCLKEKDRANYLKAEDMLIRLLHGYAPEKREVKTTDNFTDWLKSLEEQIIDADYTEKD